MTRLPFYMGFWPVVLAALLFGAACDTKNEADDQPLCERQPDLPECSECGGTGNPPAIIRTEFAPKEGRIPLNVTFDLVAEDLDTKFCGDVLTFHIDFDGDGYVDYEGTEGRGIEYTYTEAGDFKVGIWVTDSKGNVSSKVVKLVKTRPNQPPVISRFSLSGKTQDEVPFDAVFVMGAYDLDGPGGKVQSLTLDFGDGETTALSPDSTRIDHRYSKTGNFTATLKACDDSVCVERNASVLAVTPIVSSNFIQTSGSSKAISIDDNGGQHYNHPEYGLHDYVYVADGSIALKVLRMPVAAASTAETYDAPTHLIGMVDGQAANWNDVVHHKNLAVVAGLGGIEVFDVNPHGLRSCEGPWDTNCFPGSVTRPARICSGSHESNMFLPFLPHIKLELYEHQTGGTAETWAVSVIGSGTNTQGGIAAFQLDVLSYAPHETPDYRFMPRVSTAFYTYDSSTSEVTISGVSLSKVKAGDWFYDENTMSRSRIARVNASAGVVTLQEPIVSAGGAAALYEGYRTTASCWLPPGKSSPSPYSTAYDTTLYQRESKDAFSDNVMDLEVEGGYAYIAMQRTGVRVINLSRYVETKNATYSYLMSQDETVIGTKLWQPLANSVLLTEREEIEAVLQPADFSSASGSAACLETNAIEAGSVAWSNGATLSTVTAIRPGNRVALTLTEGGDDDNGGAGYLVTANDGAATLIEPAPSSSPVSWTTVYTIPVSYAVLPKYPGENPVTMSTSLADTLGRNGKCLNRINAYEPVTAPVQVTYATAPLLIAPINSSYANGKGLFVFDRSNPVKPKKLGVVGGLEGANFGEIIDNRFYLGSTGLGSPIRVVDLADPYRVTEYYNSLPLPKNIGTFQYQQQTADDTLIDFSVNEMQYYRSALNEKGVLLIASGEMGLVALDLHDHLIAGPNALITACKSQYRDSPCMVNAPEGAHLRHDGVIKDISVASNRYALVAQERGGVLVFDISAAKYGADPQFISHIRTTGSPEALNVITNEYGAPMTLTIADTDSLYVIPFTDPANPGYNHVGFLPDTKVNLENITCAASTADRNFTCAYNVDDTTGVSYVSLRGEAIPSIPMKFRLETSPEPRHDCSYADGDIPVSGYFRRIESTMLANRLFLFGETSTSAYKNVIREVELNAQGDLALDGNGDAVGCQWKFTTYRGSLLAYQHRVGAVYAGKSEWKRLYTAEKNGTIAIFDIDTFEDMLNDSTADINNGPPLIKTTDLQDWNDNQALVLKRMVAVGPYLFIAAGESGAWIVDVTNPLDPSVVGQSRISEGTGSIVNTLNAVVFPTNPGDPDTSYTYLALIGVSEEGGGIRLMRFPGLWAP